MVTVKLNLSLINKIGQKELSFKIEKPKQLKDILEKIGLSTDEVGMVIRNNRWSPLDSIIEENDEIEIFPNLDGG